MHLIDLVCQTFKNDNIYFFLCHCGDVSHSKSNIFNHVINCNYLQVKHPAQLTAFLSICNKQYPHYINKYKKDIVLTNHDWWQLMKSELGVFQVNFFRCASCKAAIPLNKPFVVCHLLNCKSISLIKKNSFRTVFKQHFPDELDDFLKHCNDQGVRYFVRGKSDTVQSIVPETTVIQMVSKPTRDFFICQHCQSCMPYVFDLISDHLNSCQNNSISLEVTPPLSRKRSSSCKASLVGPNQQKKLIEQENPKRLRKNRKSTNSLNEQVREDEAIVELPTVYFNGVFDTFGFFSLTDEFICFKCKAHLYSLFPRVYLLHLLYCLTESNSLSNLILWYDEHYPNEIEDFVERFDKKCLVRSLSDQSFLKVLELVRKVKLTKTIKFDENTLPVGNL